MIGRSRVSVAVGVWGVIHGLVLLGGLLAPYGFATQHRDFPFAPPSRIHFVDSQGGWHPRPWVYRLVPDKNAGFGYREDQSEKFPIRFLVRGDPYKILGWSSFETHLVGVDRPAKLFLAGTDSLGRDVFSRILIGGQLSVMAGLLATVVALGIGLAVGMVAGFYGGWRDAALMRGAELFLALPWLYLLLGLRAFMPLRVSTIQSFFLVVLVIGIVGWARPAQLVRNLVATLREREFFVAARSTGSANARLIRSHVLPHVTSPILTQGALLVPRYIMAEVTLSFFGLGVGEPFPSWGNMLADLQNYHVLVSYWWMLLPGIPLVIVSLGYYGFASWIRVGGKLPT
ncbi:MAG: ABC transporter permease [Thermoanaerobaculia bacterium]